MIFSENRFPLFRIMLQGKAIVPPSPLPAARGFPPRPRAFLLDFTMKHDLFRKPVSTPDQVQGRLHALGPKSPTMSRLFVALVLATAGAILFGQGIYIHAKAMLAQMLLERALPKP
jgi:hypothetical protein